MKINFVLDYVTFEFEDYSLDSLSLPKILSGDKVLSENQECQNGLQDLVGLSVSNISESDQELRVELSNGKTIVITNSGIPLGREFAVLSGQGNFFGSWISEQN